MACITKNESHHYHCKWSSGCRWAVVIGHLKVSRESEATSCQPLTPQFSSFRQLLPFPNLSQKDLSISLEKSNGTIARNVAPRNSAPTSFSHCRHSTYHAFKKHYITK
eukprot:2579342-Amphidinium_carterae.1